MHAFIFLFIVIVIVIFVLVFVINISVMSLEEMMRKLASLLSFKVVVAQTY